ncbi:hypothetical protein [Allocoleopsis sp.]|uniref:hypothetical protein n=1 Tax=Allocoleopsis sp. TaxID=3088169 RepID=UPI002FD6173E
MKSQAKFRSNPGFIGSVLGFAAVSLSSVVMASLSIHPVIAQASAQDNNPRIAPIQSHPDGKTYGQWAADWWKWAAQTPASNNPLLDKGDCSVEQKGHVWFLGGTFSGQPAERNCTVPTGTKLFFPLVNILSSAFQSDPPEQRTEVYLRTQADNFFKQLTLLEATIDGVPVKKPTQYLVKSPIFNVKLPPENIFGLNDTIAPELLLSPSVDQGYYLFLQPLPPGKHTITWKAKVGTFEQNVTYNIVVKPGRN